MNLEKGRISSSELVYLFMAVTLSTVTILGVASKNGPIAWLVTILGAIEASVFIWIFSALSAKFVDKTFVEISDIVFGRYFGKVMAGLYLWFLFHIGSLTITDSSEFIMSTVFAQTPIWVMHIGFTLVSMYAVRCGIEVIARCAGVLVPIFVLSSVATVVLSIPIIDVQNFLPLWDISVKELLTSSHLLAVLPLAESVVLLMVTPFMNENRKAPGIFLKALLITSAIAFMIAVRNVGVLGPTVTMSVYPSFESVELISIGGVLTRIEVLVSISRMSLGFLTITTFMYAVVLGMSQLLGLRSYQPLVIPVGILMMISAANQFANVPAVTRFITFVSPIYHPFFEVVIPLTTLITAKIRGVPK